MKTLLTACFLFIGLTLFGQDDTAPRVEKDQGPPTSTKVDASYPGGYLALVKEVQESFVMPEIPAGVRPGGKEVYLSFIVDKTGEVTKVFFRYFPDNFPIPGTKEAAIKTVKNLKHKFTPATQGGVPKDTRVLVPLKLAW